MINILFIALGAAMGASLRYFIAVWTGELSSYLNFPMGTLLANLLGCFVIGLLTTLGELRELFSPETRLLIFTGFLGSLTTFSTFGMEAFTLHTNETGLLAYLHVAAHVLLGLACVWAGTNLALWLWRGV